MTVVSPLVALSTINQAQTFAYSDTIYMVVDVTAVGGTVPAGDVAFVQFNNGVVSHFPGTTQVYNIPYTAAPSA